ncbi:MAG: 2-phosphosulfolactate phosphatase [Pseudonocardia sp.]|nr:2-phosphosulfolactate phosphatase [Pseudonocardia sp.]
MDQFREAHGQLSYSLRMEWGPTGADAVRNRQAAATWLLHRREADPAIRVAIIAAGERWRDGSLRPAIEDLWGVGALVAALAARGWTGISLEARAAAAAFNSVADGIGPALQCCASGQELAGLGYPEDVDTAAQLGRSHAVPVLEGEAFVPR